MNIYIPLFRIFLWFEEKIHFKLRRSHLSTNFGNWKKECWMKFLLGEFNRIWSSYWRKSVKSYVNDIIEILTGWKNYQKWCKESLDYHTLIQLLAVLINKSYNKSLDINIPVFKHMIYILDDVFHSKDFSHYRLYWVNLRVPQYRFEQHLTENQSSYISKWYLIF